MGVRSNLWPWGDTWDANRCNSSESGFNATTPVGLYPDGASPLGVMDLVGNVWEWCADWWADDLYAQREGQDVRDPAGPASGSERVLRGGSWNNNRRNCRAACRNRNDPTHFNDNVGFRVALSHVFRRRPEARVVTTTAAEVDQRRSRLPASLSLSQRGEYTTGPPPPVGHAQGWGGPCSTVQTRSVRSGLRPDRSGYVLVPDGSDGGSLGGCAGGCGCGTGGATIGDPIGAEDIGGT